MRIQRATVAATQQRAGAVLAVDPWILESPVKAAPEAPPMGLSLGGEPPGVGKGESPGETATLQGTEPQQPNGFIIYKLLSSLAQANSLQSVFNILETDEPSIA